MNNSRRTVDAGACIGGSACAVCEHITFVKNQYGFDSPMADEPCHQYTQCVQACIYDPYREDEPGG